MAKELEIEAKNLLTETEFMKLLASFSIQKEQFITQSNHYFETDDLALKNKGAALRIREKDGRFTLTLKLQQEDGVLETHQTISREEATNMIEGQVLLEGEIKDELQSLQINITTLHFLGTLKTERAEIAYKDGLLVFDKSFYFDCIDYEIEYEGSSKGVVSANFGDLLATHDIPVREMQHKIARFFVAKQSHLGSI